MEIWSYPMYIWMKPTAGWHTTCATPSGDWHRSLPLKAKMTRPWLPWILPWKKCRRRNLNSTISSLVLLKATTRPEPVDKGHALVEKFADRLDEQLQYYAQFKGKDRESIQQEIRSAGSYYQMLFRIMQQYEIKGGDMKQIQDSEFYKRYQNALKPFGMA